MRIIHVILAALILMTLSNTCLGKDWRGITPLKSSRADVERVFGKPTGPLPTYYLSDVTVTFWYSHCRCGDKCKDDAWNVPVDTVISTHVDLKGVFKLADLGLDLSQFKKSRLADDLPGSFIYSNAKEGFAIEGGVEYVSTLIYGPRAEDDHLRCRNPSSPQTKVNQWREIVPLHSTRLDVERLLGRPTGECNCIYKSQDADVLVDYAVKRCKGVVHGWNVPANTVLRVTVHLKEPRKLADLKLDLRNYRIIQDDTFTRYISSKREGVEYRVSSEDVVGSISYFPSSDEMSFRCNGFPLEDGSATGYVAFDRFGNLKPEDEATRLDNLAIALSQSTNLKGYIVVYAGKTTCRNEARVRADRARQYLIDRRGIDPKGIQAIDGGYRESFLFEVYALPKDAEPPAAVSTLSANDVKTIKNRKRCQGQKVGTRR